MAMDSKYYKTVLFPIVVSAGEFCWGPSDESFIHRICPHFSNEGGHPLCGFDIGSINYTPEGFVRKPKECLALNETKTKKEESKT